jgi:DNA mismatch repair protein MutS2
LERLVRYTDFSAGASLARALTPAPEYREARERLTLTREARELLLERSNFDLGGALDVRPLVERAQHGMTLVPSDLLEVKDTLFAAARIHRLLTNLEGQFPHLADIAWRIPSLTALIAAIEQVLDERGEVRDDASPELADIRRELRIAQDRIQERLQRMLSSPDIAPYLQEPIITRREGRFVLPVQANFKGYVQGVVHDRSASGVTLFMEPLSIVELNNTLRELRLAEEEEVHRLLMKLTMEVAGSEDEIHATIEALAELDLTFAKARYAEDLMASEPELLPIPADAPPVQAAAAVADENYHPNTVVRLRGARHPLLDPETVVPVDVDLNEETHVLVITGPNTGGKTVTLKTVGMLTLMAQAGMHIPVDPGSSLSYFEHVYADIGDEQSIEQSLSTFSAHLNNILSFLSEADHRDLVLLDELGAGTDPAEGAVLAHALLDAFRRKRCMAFVATHYPELKVYAHNTPGVRNGSVEFDVETLSPTYHLTIGIPGRSNAFAIAKRLGMPEELVAEAQAMLSGDALRADDMLDDLHSLRIEAAQLRDETHKARREAQTLNKQLRQRLDNIEEERQAVLREAREEARQEVTAVREEVQDLRRKLRTIPSSWAEVRSDLNEIDKALTQTEASLPEETPAASDLTLPQWIEDDTAPPRVGDTVKVAPLGMQGVVVDVDADEGEAVVQAGALHSRVGMHKLELVQRGQPARPEPTTVVTTRRDTPGMQLDLRGLRAEDALQRLERYLNDTMMTNLPWVRIIHGKGTGTLRREVRSFLHDHPVVASYESAQQNEGGEGATVVHLVRSSSNA